MVIFTVFNGIVLMKIYASLSSVFVGLFIWLSLFFLAILSVYLFYEFYSDNHDEFPLFVIVVCIVVMSVIYPLLRDSFTLFKYRNSSLFEFDDDTFYYRDSGSLNYNTLSLSDIDSVRFSGHQVWFVYITLKDSSLIVIRTDELNIDNKILMKAFQDFAKLQPAFGWDWTDLKRHHKPHS